LKGVKNEFCSISFNPIINRRVVNKRFKKVAEKFRGEIAKKTSQKI